MGEEGLVFTGILLLAIGVGLLTGRVAAWTLMGLGGGFLAMAVMRLMRRRAVRGK